jgi:flagellar biosynthesis protein FliQ
MTESFVISFAMKAIMVTLEIATPFLLVSLILGSIISLIQAATQIQEVTITFIPKFAAMVAIIIVLGGWMLQTIVAYTAGIFQSLPGLVH